MNQTNDTEIQKDIKNIVEYTKRPWAQAQQHNFNMNYVLESLEDLCNKKAKLKINFKHFKGDKLCEVCNVNFLQDELIFQYQNCKNIMQCKDCIQKQLIDKINFKECGFQHLQNECLNPSCQISPHFTYQQLLNLLGKQKLNDVIERDISKDNQIFNCPGCRSPLFLDQNDKNLVNRKNIYCQNQQCKIKICLICKNYFHQGNCENPFPDFIIEQIKQKIYAICPYHLAPIEKKRKEENKGEDCENIYCEMCKKNFNFCCSSPRTPVTSHNNQYHRFGCRFYEESPENEKYNPKCENCVKLKNKDQPCKEPISLEEFMNKVISGEYKNEDQQ